MLSKRYESTAVDSISWLHVPDCKTSYDGQFELMQPPNWCSLPLLYGHLLINRNELVLLNNFMYLYVCCIFTSALFYTGRGQ